MDGVLDEEIPRLGWGQTNPRKWYWDQDSHLDRLQCAGLWEEGWGVDPDSGPPEQWRTGASLTVTEAL